jgi:hypothetical protein
MLEKSRFRDFYYLGVPTKILPPPSLSSLPLSKLIRLILF